MSGAKKTTTYKHCLFDADIFLFDADISKIAKVFLTVFQRLEIANN